MEADFFTSNDNSSTDWAEINLTNSELKVLIDKEDLELVSQYRWRLNTYVIANQVIRIHRLIMSSHGHDLEGKQVDHKNHNVLDNRKANLRVCTNGQNKANSTKNKTNKSGYKGVQKVGNRYIARAGLIHIGSYLTAEEAAVAYNTSALAQWGEFAYLNKVDSSIVPKKCTQEKKVKTPKAPKGISNEQAAKLRELASSKEYTCKELATMFNISKEYVWDIVTKRRH